MLKRNIEFKSVVIWNNSLKLIPIPCQRSFLQVTSFGLETNNNPANCNPDQKYVVKSDQTSNQCSFVFVFFFHVRGGVDYSEICPPAQTVNQSFYRVVRRLRNTIHQKRPDLWHTGDWIFHQDACTHDNLCYPFSCATYAMVSLPYSLDLTVSCFPVPTHDKGHERSLIWQCWWFKEKT